MKRKFRITRAIDFKRVRRSGRSYAHPLAVIIAHTGESENSRAGIISSRSIGKAVQRNRVKRQIRAILAPLLPNIQKNTDLLIIAREAARNATFDEIQAAVNELLERAKLICPHDSNAGRPTP